MGRTLVISLILGASWPLVAQSDITTDIATKEQRSDIESVKIDSTSTRAIETARAEQWGLSHEDWQRYRSLMQGVRGSISPSTLSPIEVLGIHARNAGRASPLCRALGDDDARGRRAYSGFSARLR